MGAKVATTCLQWSQPNVHHSSRYLQTQTTILSYHSSMRKNLSDGEGLIGRCVYTLGQPSHFGILLSKFHYSHSFNNCKPTIQTIGRARSSNITDGFSDEEFSKHIQDLVLRFQVSTEKSQEPTNDHEFNKVENHSKITQHEQESTESPCEIHHEPQINPYDMERKANCVNFPSSLRILKKKMQWQEGIREARESAYCSVKKAFSSMVFMIQELHNYSLKLREILFYEDLRGILNRVEKEMQASFVWLFQQVFSHTPTLMVYVMILLANFTVHSMGNNLAIAASLSSTPTLTEVLQINNQKLHQKLDSSTIKTFSISSINGKTTSIGGNGDDGGAVRPTASGTDDDGFNQSVNCPTVVPGNTSQLSLTLEENIKEEEMHLWNSILNEASKMKSDIRSEAIDEDVTRRFVSPVTAKMESEDYIEYFKTELLYQTRLSQDPKNPLLLTNYAQFLYLVAHDYDRAEGYFKKAVEVKPADAEALNKYATFLWRVRKNMWAAEETFLEAISADSTNPFYSAKYANFLWSSGVEETCYDNL